MGRIFPKVAGCGHPEKYFFSAKMAGGSVPRAACVFVRYRRKQNQSQSQSHLQQNRSQSQSQLQHNRSQRLLSLSILDLIVSPRSELFRNRIAKRGRKNLASRTESLGPRSWVLLGQLAV